MKYFHDDEYEDVRDNFEEMDVDELNNKILKIYANPNLGIEEKKSVHSMCYVDIRLKRTQQKLDAIDDRT